MLLCYDQGNWFIHNIFFRLDINYWFCYIHMVSKATGHVKYLEKKNKDIIFLELR